MNKCQKCQKARATVHLTEIDPENHKPHEMHLCEECARDTGMPQSLSPLATSAVFKASLAIQEKGGRSRAGAYRLACDQCGMSYQEFRVKGRFGCAACYDAFAEPLVPLLEKVHGASRHVGDAPGRPKAEAAPAAQDAAPEADPAAERADDEKELQDLKKRLTRAVKDEDYEDAARLRDRIQEVMQRLSGRSDA